jgi:membrane-associated phospholipid phosphatase
MRNIISFYMYATLHKNFKIALGLSLLLAIVLFGMSYFYSRETLFLLLNTDLGKMGDISFKYITYLAEGWIWIPYFLVIMGWYKKEALFILFNFLISTLLTQIPKNFIWDTVSRPMASGIPQDQIHRVQGVDMHLWNSFPSGHTATAFTIFLVTVYLFPKKEVLVVGIFYAIACGYSRVYLAQHFPLDVAGGIVVAILTVFISLFISSKIKNDVQKIK